MKIFTTAVFSVVLLRKKISVVQWVAVSLLGVAVALVQVKGWSLAVYMHTLILQYTMCLIWSLQQIDHRTMIYLLKTFIIINFYS